MLHRRRSTVEQHALQQEKRRSKRRWLPAVIMLLLLVLVAAGAGVVTLLKKPHASFASSSDHMPSLGVNVTYSQRVFADAMKTTGLHWDSPNNFGNGGATMGPDNWPASDGSVMVWQGSDKNDGTYQLIFNGQATLGTSFGYGTFSNQHYDAATNTTTAAMLVTDTGHENFSMVFTNTKRTATSPTNSGVTNVHLMLPTAEGASTSYPESELFTTWIKDAVAPYTYLRFMDGVNGNTSRTWSQRTLPGSITQVNAYPGEMGSNMISYEYMVLFCNQTGKDLYVNIPHLVDDDYVTKLAQLIKYGSDGVNPYTAPQANPIYPPLNANLHVYTEYSNEVWNWMFQQTHDVYNLANAEVAAGGSNLSYDGNTNTSEVTWRYYARRVVQISNLFRGIFGDGDMMTRVRPFLEWQYDNAQNTAAAQLNFLQNYYNNGDGQNHVTTPHPINYFIWGGGGAVYFSSNNDAAGSADAIYASGIPSSDYAAQLKREAAWAHAYGLHDVAYEGGMALGGDAPNAVTLQARYDPRAKQAMLDSFNDFAAAGGDLYTAGTYYQWSDVIGAPSSPLVQAAAMINSSTFQPAPIQLGNSVGATGTTTIAATTDSVGADFSRPITGENGYYILRVSNPGTYTLSISTNEFGSVANNGQAQIYINDLAVGGPTAMPPSSTITFGTVTLNAGLNALRIQTLHGSYDSAHPTDNFYYQWQPTKIMLTAGATSQPAQNPTMQPVDTATATPTATSITQPVANPTATPTATSITQPVVNPTATPTATSIVPPVVATPTATSSTQPTATPVPPAAGATPLFSNGFEGSDAPLTWTNTIDNQGFPAGGSNHIAGVCCALTGPEAGPRDEMAYTGTHALMYSGNDTDTSSSYSYMQLFDLSSKNITVSSTTTLEYWIYPQSSNLTNGKNSTCVALDLIFSNGSNLRDSGAIDQNGNRAHPAYQCNKLTLNSWNHVVINLGAHSSGSTIVRLDLGYDQTDNTGGFRGYVDDISLHN